MEYNTPHLTSPKHYAPHHRSDECKIGPLTVSHAADRTGGVVQIMVNAPGVDIQVTTAGHGEGGQSVRLRDPGDVLILGAGSAITLRHLAAALNELSDMLEESL